MWCLKRPFILLWSDEKKWKNFRENHILFHMCPLFIVYRDRNEHWIAQVYFEQWKIKEKSFAEANRWTNWNGNSYSETSFFCFMCVCALFLVWEKAENRKIWIKHILLSIFLTFFPAQCLLNNVLNNLHCSPIADINVRFDVEHSVVFFFQSLHIVAVIVSM